MQATAPATPAATTAPAAASILRAFLPRLGDPVIEAGGIAAAIMRGRDGVPDYLLIVSPAESGEGTDLAFGNYGKRVENADHDTDGLGNTIALTESGIAHPAAQFCRDLNLAGHTDWYLPARHELRACYLNVPELFNTDDWYWSSTQYAGSRSSAWYQSFVNGNQYYRSKDYRGRARAVRRLIIQ